MTYTTNLSPLGLVAPACTATGAVLVGLIVESWPPGILTIAIAGGPVYALILAATRARQGNLTVTPEAIQLQTKTLGGSTRTIPRAHATRITLTRGPLGRLTDTWKLDIENTSLRPSHEHDDSKRLTIHGIRNAHNLLHTIEEAPA